jgi:hypothetical protein
MCYRRLSRREVKGSSKFLPVVMVSGFDCRGCLGWFAQVAISPPTDLYGWEVPLNGDPGRIINPNHETHHFWFCRQGRGWGTFGIAYTDSCCENPLITVY